MRQFSLGRRVAAAFIASFICVDSSAQTAPAYPAGAHPRAVRLDAAEAAPRIDGRLDDAVWQRAPVAYRTTLQVVIDDNAITFGIRAFDPTPADIRAPLA